MTRLDDEVGSGRRQVSVLLPGWLCGFRAAAFEPEAVVSGLHDMAAMSEAIEQRGRHLGAAEDRRSFAEAEVRADDDTGSFIEFAEQMEEQRATRRAERQIAQFVEDDEIGVDQASGDLACLAVVLFLFEGVDEFDGGEEPDALAVMLDGVDADRGGDMRFAGAGAADEDNVVGVVEELTAMELTHKRLIDLAAGEVEAGYAPVGREARRR